jgi:hypothetical protein
MAELSAQTLTDASLFGLARTSDKVLERLLQDIGNSVFSKDSDLLDDSLGRFRVWARNLGAFENAESKRSLDYRLRNGEEMRDAVRGNLVEIKDSSLRGVFIYGSMALFYLENH